jgi:hypothetical protein
LFIFIFKARLMKISPAGLHTELRLPLANPLLLVRNDSITSNSKDETTDYFNSNVPLTRMRPGLRKVDSTKTFDTVSSLGSSDAVDQVSQSIYISVMSCHSISISILYFYILL